MILRGCRTVNPHPGAAVDPMERQWSPLALRQRFDIFFDGRSMTLARVVPGQSSVGSMGYIQTNFTGE